MAPIDTIDDMTHHGGIDPRSYLGYAWEVIDGSVGRDWLREFADLRGEERVDVRCDSCGDLIHMAHDEASGVWIRVNTKAVCAQCILSKTLDADGETAAP